ncbi:hypothetical protein [Mycolicibacterium sp. XJ1819]
MWIVELNIAGWRVTRELHIRRSAFRNGPRRLGWRASRLRQTGAI